MSATGPLPVVADLVTAMASADRFDAVVSLAGERDDGSALGSHPNRLYCPFEDVAFAIDPGAISHDQAKQIVRFVEASPGSLLVHCRYGQSRSTATALAVAAVRGHDPYDAAELLLEAHPPDRPFIPNPLVLVVFDRFLGLRGALIEAGMECVRF